jgi:putative ABC transport system substrate-binding protein
VVPALEKLLPRINLLLALPDPVAHNRNTVQPLLLTTYRAGIPVIGYSESYLQAGSTLALYSTVPNFTAQIIESLQQFFEGRPPAAIQVPRYYTVGINNAVARSLGLLLPSERELQDRLRSSDQ